MRIAATALAALMASGLAGGAAAESLVDEIQDEEQPGSQIEIGVGGGGGGVEIGRERSFTPSPVEIEGQVLDAPNDPDMPEANSMLPGQGPQDLSGPDDDDSLPE